MQVRIKHAQIKAITEELLRRQGGLCEICEKEMTQRDGPVLDHDHDTGVLRGVIHRSCNAAEGKVRIKAMWAHKGVGKTNFLIGLGKYLEKHKNNPRNLLHSSWLSKKEKAVMKILK
jgi:Recombination endonuclease VII